MTFKKFVEEQAGMHPAFKPQDAVKMCYQAEFGAEHLVTDKEKMLEYLVKEFDEVEPTEDLIVEEISEDYVRVNLGAWKSRFDDVTPVAELFFATAGTPTNGNEQHFFSRIEDVREAAAEGSLTFGTMEFDMFIEEYKKGGVRAIHHSDYYRENEHPAYRLVRKDLIQDLPWLAG